MTTRSRLIVALVPGFLPGIVVITYFPLLLALGIEHVPGRTLLYWLIQVTSPGHMLFPGYFDNLLPVQETHVGWTYHAVRWLLFSVFNSGVWFGLLSVVVSIWAWFRRAIVQS